MKRVASTLLAVAFLVGVPLGVFVAAALEAGCRAAIKSWPLLGYGSPPPTS